MNKTNLLIILLVLVSITGGLFAQQHLNTDDGMASINPALEFKLPDLDGKPFSISDYPDKIRIINFWATWCPPCLKEIPEFIKIQHELADKGVQFIGIAIDNKQSVEAYVNANPVNYPILLAEKEGTSLSQQLGNVFKAVPFTLIVNKEGQIVYSQPGEISREKILQLIMPLVENRQ